MKKIVFRIIFLILILIISSIIFGFSNQNGETSSGISKKIITKIADIVNINNEKRTTFIIEGEKVIRKLAHFGIYTLLGLFSMSFFATFKISRVKQTVMTTSWGILYASTDELHQLFINGRNASILDVILDTSGVIFGIFIVILILNIVKKLKTKEYKK